MQKHIANFCGNVRTWQTKQSFGRILYYTPRVRCGMTMICLGTLFRTRFLNKKCMCSLCTQCEKKISQDSCNSKAQGIDFQCQPEKPWKEQNYSTLAGCKYNVKDLYEVHSQILFSDTQRNVLKMKNETNGKIKEESRK